MEKEFSNLIFTWPPFLNGYRKLFKALGLSQSYERVLFPTKKLL